MKDAWFLQQQDDLVGPVPFERLRVLCREGVVKPATPVRDGQYAEWSRAERVAGLFPQPKQVAAPRDRDWLPGVLAVLGFAGLLAFSLVILGNRSNRIAREQNERITRETAERNVSLAMERAERWMSSDGADQFEFQQIERALKLAELEPCEKAKEVPELSRSFLMMGQKFAEDAKADAKYHRAVQFLDQGQVPQALGLLKDYDEGRYGTRHNDARRWLEQIAEAQSADNARGIMKALPLEVYEKFLNEGALPALPPKHPALATVQREVLLLLRKEEARMLTADRAAKALGDDTPLVLKAENPLMLLHPDVNSILLFRVNDLLTNPVFLKILRIDPLGVTESLGKQLTDIANGFGVNPLRDIDQLAVGFINTDFATARASLVLSGKFDSTKVHAGIRKEAAKNGLTVRVVQYKGLSIFDTDGPMNTLPCTAVLGDRHIVAASDLATLKGILDGRQEGPKKAIELIAGVKKGTVLCFAVDCDQEWFRNGVDTIQLPNVDADMQKLLRTIRQVRFEWSMDRDVEIALHIKTRDQESAKTLNDTLLPLLDQVKGLAPIFAGQVPPELGRWIQHLVASARIEHKGETVVFSMKCEEGFIDQQLAQVKKQ